MNAVIMAGGTGTRLWPISRQKQPKQSQPLMEKQTMAQKTFRRLRRGWSAQRIFVSTNIQQLAHLRRQLPQVPSAHFIVEPVRRDTAAAIGLAAATLWKKHPREFMFTASSDHYFRETDEYIRILKTAQRVAYQYPHRTVLIGVKPTWPHTGLGYIKMKQPIGRISRDEIFSVDRFVEKPNEKTARRFVSSWQYLWNINMFMFRVDALLEKYRRFMPKSHRLLMRIAKDIGTPRERSTIKRLFPKMERVAIDYGIMEHDRHMIVVPADVTWADIGSWREVYEMLATKPGENVIRGQHVGTGSAGNLIYTYGKKIVATAGVHDLAIIDTPDALLICPRHRAQDVKKIVAELEARKLSRHL